MLMHDNCPSFVAKETKDVLAHLNVPCMLTSPGSFQASVVEGCFQVMKSVNYDHWNGENGKALVEISNKKLT